MENKILKRMVKIDEKTGRQFIELGASKLKSFDPKEGGCPLKFRLNTIEKISKTGQKNEYAALGTAFHTVAEIMYSEQNFDRRFMLGSWEGAFNEAMSDPDIRRLTQFEKDRLKRQGYPILQNFYSTEKSEGMLRKPLHLELPFRVPYTTVDDIDIVFTGKMDRVIVHDDEEYVEITDYKTTKQAAMSVKQVKKDTQARIYYYFYRKMRLEHDKDKEAYANVKFPYKKIIFSMFYVRRGEKVEASWNKEERIKIKKYLDDVIERLFESDFKPVEKDPKGACKFCEHQGVCPSWGNKLPDLKKLRKKVNPKKMDLGHLRKWKNDKGDKMEIKDFQLEDVAHMVKHRTVLNANQVGTGKTVESIALVEHLRVTDDAKRVLLFAPKVLLRQWANEIKDWTGKSKKSFIVKGGRKKRKDKYGKRLWTIVNYEKAKSDIKEINKVPWDIIIIDEAQRIKGERAQSSRTIRNLVAKYKIALTGTPIGAKLDHLFRIMAWVKPGLLGPWQVFQKRHIVKNKWTGKIIKYINLGEVREKLGNYFIRRKKRDVMKDLPPESISVIEVAMSKRQKILYEENVEEILALIKDGEQNEDNVIKFLDTPAGGKYIRLRCLLGCTQTIDPEGKFDSPKYDAMLPFIRDIVENGEKVIIFSQFRKIIGILQRELSKEFSNILRLTGSGKEDQMDREDIKKLFNTSDKHQILLMTDAGKYGLNLQSCSYMFNFEAPEDPEVITQRVGRISRHGQKNAMTIWNLVVKDSLEEKIIKKRHSKAKVSKIVVDQESDADEVNFDDIKTTMNLKDLKELLI